MEGLSAAFAGLQAIEPTTLLLVAGAAILGSVLSAVTGSGAGIVLSIVLLPVLGVRALVPVISVAMIVSHIARLHVFSPHVRWREGSIAMLAAIPGSIVGSAIYAELPDKAIAAVLGVFLLGLIVARHMRKTAAPHLSPVIFGLLSFGFGVLSGLTLGAGILLLPLLMSLGLAGTALVATDAFVGLGINLTKAIAFGGLDVLTPDLFVIGIIVGALTLPGAYIARAILNRISLKTHGYLIDAMIAVAALGMLHSAITG